MMSSLTKINHWFWFVLCLSVAPLAYSCWDIFSRGEIYDARTAFSLAIQHGELIIVCIPMLGGCIGELINNEYSTQIPKTIVGGLILLLFFFAASTFVGISSANIFGEAKSPAVVMKISISIFVGTLMTSVASIILSIRFPQS